MSRCITSAIPLDICPHMHSNDDAQNHMAYLEIVCNERPKFTLQQPPGERETSVKQPSMVQLLVSSSQTHDDDGVLTNGTGTEARPQKGALSSALVIPLHQYYWESG